jgi:hypothetical protein
MVFIQIKKKECILKISVLKMGHFFPLTSSLGATTSEKFWPSQGIFFSTHYGRKSYHGLHQCNIITKGANITIT